MTLSMADGAFIMQRRQELSNTAVLCASASQDRPNSLSLSSPVPNNVTRIINTDAARGSGEGTRISETCRSII